MKLLFKQRFFSWFDSYDIYDEQGNTYFTVEGKFAWGHLFHILNSQGMHIGTLEEQIFRFLPHFNLYEGARKVGEIVKEFTFLLPRFTMDCSSWVVEGDWIEWDYTIRDGNRIVATISKEIFRWTDTYVLDVADERDALRVLMIVLAIDAVKCRNN